jgi:hypothetical protein
MAAIKAADSAADFAKRFITGVETILKGNALPERCVTTKVSHDAAPNAADRSLTYLRLVREQSEQHVITPLAIDLQVA